MVHIKCQYHLFNKKMSLPSSLWDIFNDEPPINFHSLQFEPKRQLFDDRINQNLNLFKFLQQCIDSSQQLAHPLIETRSEQKQSSSLSPPIQQVKETNTQLELSEEDKRRRKKFKTSPYHNFQKHLNTAIRHIVTFPPLHPDSPKSLVIAQRLWTVFLMSKNSTKKLLSFVFNEFNEYRIKPNQLRDLGFEEIYSAHSRDELGEAKTFLTKLAIDQLNEEKVADYLETRRIRNSQKFQKYISVFRNELVDGFLKKRITNRNRKEKIKKQLMQMRE